jgi:hypothetical protein
MSLTHGGGVIGLRSCAFPLTFIADQKLDQSLPRGALPYPQTHTYARELVVVPHRGYITLRIESIHDPATLALLTIKI